MGKLACPDTCECCNHFKAQIGPLAAFILEHHAEEIGRGDPCGEGACAVALRLLQQFYDYGYRLPPIHPQAPTPENETPND